MPCDDLYYAVADVVRQVHAKERSVRGAVYGHDYENKKKLLRLACQTIKFKQLLDGILEDRPLCKALLGESAYNEDVSLLHVLLYEFLAGNGLNQASQYLKKPIFLRAKQIHDREKILASENRGVDALRSANSERELTCQEPPRYARINMLKWGSREEALEKLEQEEWKLVELGEDDNFAKRVAYLKDDEVILDPHIPELLVFPNTSDFHSYWMVAQRYLILQDKASCLPAFLLHPPVGAHCLDACAAPGNKTSHLAAIVGVKGSVIALDRANDRVKTMRQLLRGAGANNVHVECADFLRTDPNDETWTEVEYALVDPPCSGSGIVKRMDEWTGGDRDVGRLAKLANLQAMLLKHALRIPSLKRLVYSTCSVHEEENEGVVREVLNELGNEWRLAQDILPSWTLRGLDTYDFGPCCLRADPKETLTNGFFVAVFERKGLDENTSSANEENTSRKKNKKKKKKVKKLDE